MKRVSLLFSSLALLFGVVSCTPKEEEREIDYEHMAMADDEEEWSTGDRKVVAEDRPDPQELLILDFPEKK
jgi:hypothetical protein